MRALTFLTLSAALALSLEMAGPLAAGCDPVGEIRFVCGQAGPEDLVAVPGSDWIIASAFGAEGGLHLIDVKAGTSTRLFPSATAREHPDTKTYDSCPGPLEGTDREKFRTHGLYLKPGRNAVHTLFVVHHGNRESIEIFELDARPKQPPAATWIGCVVAPDPIGLNAVVALPEGGFAATNFDPRRPAGARGGFSPELLEGKNNGEVWEWHSGAGWKKVPGSEAAGANGLEISKDGKWYYLAEWGNRSFMRLSRGQTPVKRDEISLGFRVDNVRWAPDGLLFVAGQGGADAGRGQARGAAGAPPTAPTSVVGKVDPKTLKYQEIINYPSSAEVSFATVAVQIGKELWVGSSRGDRIARYPATGLRKPQ
jgi:sugar lactone lactonase YvrE